MLLYNNYTFLETKLWEDIICTILISVGNLDIHPGAAANALTLFPGAIWLNQSVINVFSSN